jgi:hypothetical protein
VGQRRKRKLAGDLAAFLRQYGRKAYPTHDPNDRGYDPSLNRRYTTGGKDDRTCPRCLGECYVNISTGDNSRVGNEIDWKSKG